MAIAPGGMDATPVPGTPAPEPASTQRPAATVVVPGSAPSGTPGVTQPPAGGGGGATPSTGVPRGGGSIAVPEAGGDGGGSNGGATAAGLAMTVAGGAALGYATSRGGAPTAPTAPAAPTTPAPEGTRPRRPGQDGDGDGETTDEEEPTLLDRGLTLLKRGATWLRDRVVEAPDKIKEVADTFVTAAKETFSSVWKALGSGPPAPPPLTHPKVTIEAGGGGDAVAKDETFRIVVETPRQGSGNPPQTIDVTLQAARGDDETVTLRWTGNVSGPPRYRSEPLTIEQGGTGGGKTTILGFEFSSGDMGNDLSDVPNGERVTVTVDGVDAQDAATFEVYETWVQLGLGRYRHAIEQLCTYWENVQKLLPGIPDSPEKTRLERHAAQIVRLCKEAHDISTNENSLDTMKLALLRGMWGIMSRPDLSQWDPRDEYDIMRSAERAGHEMNMDSFMRGMTGAVIGMWRTAADVTGYADIVKIAYGKDEMGHSVGTLDRIFAALDLAGKITVYGQTESMLAQVADFLSAGATAGRMVVRAGSAAETLTTEAGKVVEWPEEFGMLRNRAAHFEDVAERYGVRIRVRPANEAALEWMAEGHPPKHVKLKSKTINEIDELIGAPLNARGQVGYFEPRLPPLDNFDRATREAILKRYSQRSLEFHDEAQAMASLEGKGLVRVDGGVVLDTGLSDTRLAGDHLETLGRNPGGTGKAFTGDHDMWDVTKADGAPLDAATKARVEADSDGRHRGDAARAAQGLGAAEREGPRDRPADPREPRRAGADGRQRARGAGCGGIGGVRAGPAATRVVRDAGRGPGGRRPVTDPHTPETAPTANGSRQRAEEPPPTPGAAPGPTPAAVIVDPATARHHAMLTRAGLREQRDRVTDALAAVRAPSEIGVPATPEQRTALEAYARVVRDALDEATDAYFAALPRVPVARCPFTGAVAAIAIDTYGIDGPWWNYQAALRPVEARPATLLAFTGALALREPVETTVHLVKPGPGAPYVLPRLLALDGVQAVVRAVAVGRHLGWTITYFAERRPPETQGANDWGMDCYRVGGGWDTVPEDFDARDFDLAPWIERGRLAWIAPGDESATLRREVAGCPYVGLAGERNIQRVQDGKVWAPTVAPLPD